MRKCPFYLDLNRWFLTYRYNSLLAITYIRSQEIISIGNTDIIKLI
jgi:hypothetical protein